jgi:hypothetical protein
MKKALLGAFLFGAVFGAFQTEHPWRGAGILTNFRLVIGCGLGIALLVAIVWSLTALRMRAAALLWRKRA